MWGRIGTGAGALLGLVLVVAITVPSGGSWAQGTHSDRKGHEKNVFSGVVEQVDAKAMKILVKTDAGKTVDVEVGKPELLKDIGQGDRITVEVDEKEKATKIMKNISIPELKGPESATPPASGKEGVPPTGR